MYRFDQHRHDEGEIDAAKDPCDERGSAKHTSCSGVLRLDCPGTVHHSQR